MKYMNWLWEGSWNKQSNHFMKCSRFPSHVLLLYSLSWIARKRFTENARSAYGAAMHFSRNSHEFLPPSVPLSVTEYVRGSSHDFSMVYVLRTMSLYTFLLAHLFLWHIQNCFREGQTMAKLDYTLNWVQHTSYWCLSHMLRLGSTIIPPSPANGQLRRLCDGVSCRPFQASGLVRDTCIRWPGRDWAFPHSIHAWWPSLNPI